MKTENNIAYWSVVGTLVAILVLVALLAVSVYA